MNVLHTGGAHGGDRYWEKVAESKGHLIKEYHFDGHKHTRTELLNATVEPHTELIEQTPDEKEACQFALEKASAHMKSDLPNGAPLHLLERDWNMIKRSDAGSLYIVGHMGRDSRLGIKGGTGWIAELFVDEYFHKHNIAFGGGKLSFALKPLPVYFRKVESSDGFYQLCLNGLNLLKWVRVEQIPDPGANWIGVGARA